jgi:hypothetical protein
MGRERKLTDQQVIDLTQGFLNGTKSVKLAQAYGISRRTVQRIVKSQGLQRKRGRRKYEYYGKLAAYIQAHPEETYPRNHRKIAERTDSSRGAVKAFLYRRRKALEAKAKGIDFTTTRWKYKDTKGRTIPAKAIESYEVKAESWTNVVRLTCTLKGGAGRTTIRLPSKLIAHLSSKA